MTSLKQPTCGCESCINARLTKLNAQAELEAANHDDYSATWDKAAVLCLLIAAVVIALSFYAEHLHKTARRADPIMEVLAQ